MNKFTDGEGISYREYGFQILYSQPNHSPLEVKQTIKLTVNSRTRAIPCAGCVQHRAEIEYLSQCVRSEVHFRAVLVTLIPLNNSNYKCDSKELLYFW